MYWTNNTEEWRGTDSTFFQCACHLRLCSLALEVGSEAECIALVGSNQPIDEVLSNILFVFKAFLAVLHQVLDEGLLVLERSLNHLLPVDPLALSGHVQPSQLHKLGHNGHFATKGANVVHGSVKVSMCHKCHTPVHVLEQSTFEGFTVNLVALQNGAEHPSNVCVVGPQHILLVVAVVREQHEVIGSNSVENHADFLASLVVDSIIRDSGFQHDFNVSLHNWLRC